jgi:hypothetical protein
MPVIPRSVRRSTTIRQVLQTKGDLLSTAPPNGHVAEFHSASVSDQIDEHARGLEELLVPLRAERDQLKAKLSELQAREKQIAHAVGALRGGYSNAPAAKPSASTQKGGWTPSEERLKSLFELMLAEPEPISPTQLAEKTTGLGVETASKGFKILRERELIRVTGALRGGGNLFTPMPNATWPES